MYSHLHNAEKERIKEVMREQKNKSQKGIVVLLAFIAVCMVCIIVLLVSSMVTKNSGNATEVDQVEENGSADNLDDVLYHYEGELSDTPITPTEIENEWILEEYMTDMPEESFEDAKGQILKQASVYECYANPTIVDYGMCTYADNAGWLLIDFHTSKNDMGAYRYLKSGSWIPENYSGSFDGNGMWMLWMSDYEEFKPYVSGDKKTIINARPMLYEACKRNNWEYSDEELVMIQKRLLETIEQVLPKYNMSDMYKDRTYFYLESAFLEDKKSINLNLCVGTKDGEDLCVEIKNAPYDANSYLEYLY